MLPAEVAHKLKLGEKVQESFDSATILFSDIVTFTTIASRCQPHQIVTLLNDMYTRYDNATELNKVYKVETIGDAYMVVGGVPCRINDHATRVVRQALDMIRLAREVPHPISGEPVQIRVGVHTGATVAGVVGHKMPRYCLFGDAVNVASRMESHGVPGRVHISANCRRKLEMEGCQLEFEARGVIDIKGKGRMETYFVGESAERDGATNFRQVAPHDMAVNTTTSTTSADTTVNHLTDSSHNRPRLQSLSHEKSFQLIAGSGAKYSASWQHESCTISPCRQPMARERSISFDNVINMEDSNEGRCSTAATATATSGRSRGRSLIRTRSVSNSKERRRLKTLATKPCRVQ